MADETPDREYELEVVDDVEWLVDEDGTEYFVDDGTRYELGEDGYAYPVGETPRADGGPASTVPEPAPVARPTPEIPGASRRPLAASGPISGPRVPASGTAGWPRADTPVGAAAAAEQASPAGLTVRERSEEPSPFSREGESRGRRRAQDDDATREMATAAPTPSAGDDDRTDLLRLEGVRSGYGSLPVLHGVEMSVAAGQTAVLLGLNGAGKTTTAMNICGALRTWDGSITFDGQDITRWSTKKAVDAGVVMIPEGRRVFPELSVAKNLQMGGWSQRKDRDYLAAQRERVFGYFPRLRERSSQLAGTLSGGEQQMLAIARGLMARPKLLIIDEASMGLAPVIVADVFRIVGQINADGTTVLMIEQNVAALEVADVAYVMEQGRMIRELRGDAVHDLDQVSDVLMG